MYAPLRIAAFTLAAALAACGGGGSDDTEGTQTAQRVVPPLLDDQGEVQAAPHAAAPGDPAARTRAGHYATEVQAQALEAALGSQAISTRVDNGADPAEATGLAVLLVYGQQAAHDLDLRAPVLVRGGDPRLAAVVANRLADEGFSRVFLVTP